MSVVRGAGAILAFVVGLILIALGLYGLAIAWAYAIQTKQPIDFSALSLGLGASAIGILCFVAARALDPDHGPIRSYRKRPSKSHTRA